jgi:hypothetical protein
MQGAPALATAGASPLGTHQRTTPMREMSAEGAPQFNQKTTEQLERPATREGHAVFLTILFFAAFQLLFTGGACVVVSIDDSKGKASANTHMDTENTDETKADDKEDVAKQFQAILKHPFWRVEPMEKDINRIIDVILSQKPGAVIFIDDQLYTSPRSGGAFEEMHKKGIIMAPNDMQSDRYFYVEREYKAGPPTRRDILSKLRAELDTANKKMDP